MKLPKRCLLWIIIVSIVFTMIACGQQTNEKKVYGTWRFVNGNDEPTKISITFKKDGIIKIGSEGENVSVTQEEWNDVLASIFGDVSDLIKSAGINLDISAADLSESLSGILSITYEVKDSEEILFTITALKLINITHTSQYNFKKNGDLVLNGIVFRKE